MDINVLERVRRVRRGRREAVLGTWRPPWSGHTGTFALSRHDGAGKVLSVTFLDYWVRWKLLDMLIELRTYRAVGRAVLIPLSVERPTFGL